jgi:hypothetical protein
MPPGSTFLGNFGLFTHRRKHFMFHIVVCAVHICDIILKTEPRITKQFRIQSNCIPQCFSGGHRHHQGSPPL